METTEFRPGDRVVVIVWNDFLRGFVMNKGSVAAEVTFDNGHNDICPNEQLMRESDFDARLGLALSESFQRLLESLREVDVIPYQMLEAEAYSFCTEAIAAGRAAFWQEPE